MKKGDRVRTDHGVGVVHMVGDTLVSVTLDSPARIVVKVADTSPDDSEPIDSPAVDAVVGEQCEAILLRLKDALGCGSIGEVEDVVLRMQRAHPLVGQRFELPIKDADDKPVVVTFLHILADGDNFMGQLDNGHILSPLLLMWTTTLPPAGSVPDSPLDPPSRPPDP